MLLLAHSNLDPSMNYEWLTGRCLAVAGVFWLVARSLVQTSLPHSYILVPRFVLRPFFKISLYIPIYHLSSPQLLPHFMVHKVFHVTWKTGLCCTGSMCRTFSIGLFLSCSIGLFTIRLCIALGHPKVHCSIFFFFTSKLLQANYSNYSFKFTVNNTQQIQCCSYCIK